MTADPSRRSAQVKNESVVAESEPILLATGFDFTEGPLWHPEGYLYFADVRGHALYRLTPGAEPEKVRDTLFGNGTTFDLEGSLIQCEGDGRRLTRTRNDGTVELLVDRFEGARLSRPNDVVCKSDGSLYFSDVATKTPRHEREIDFSAVFRLFPDGSMTRFAFCESPNGLAFSPDESVLYVANTRYSKYIHAFDVNESGEATARRIFADMNHDDLRVPDGLKVDMEGRVYCAGGGGIWVFDADGHHLESIPFPDSPANLAFGGEDMKTLFVAAGPSVYALRMKVGGVPHPWYRLRAGTT
jgi:gluconolactonase